MTKSRYIPVDSYRVDEGSPGASDYESATVTGRELREKILSNKESRRAYDEMTGVIERHQANLARVRKARSLTQATIAETMGMDQSEVSRLERRTDLLLSTARRFIQATGGDLRLVAHYPDGDVELFIGSDMDAEDAESTDVRA
jgi:DNA-binding transcriptional regulator YiaG